MKYFLHDSNAMQDEKITELFINFGYQGTGLFFAILEKIAFAESPVSEQILLFQLKIKGKKLLKIYSFLFEIELLFNQKGKVFNENVLKVAEKYKIKKEKTKKRVSEWRKNQEVGKNVTHYKSVRNAPVTPLNKSKVNKSKVNKEKVKEKSKILPLPERKKVFFENMEKAIIDKAEFQEKGELNNFYAYWTEHGDTDKKMRFEKERSFSISRRLGVWFTNKEKWSEKNEPKLKETDIHPLEKKLIEKYGKI